MRARGVGSVMALALSGVLSVMTMRACHSSSASSPSNPVNVAHNGVAGTCANQQAVTAAGSSDDSIPKVTLPPDLAAKLGHSDPAVAAVVAQATNCPSPSSTP